MVMTADSLETSISQAVGAGSEARKPRLLVCSSPVIGHTMPIIRIAAELVDRGYDVTFLAGDEFHDAIRKIGGKPLPIDTIDWAAFAERENIPAGLERVVWDMQHLFIAPTEVRQEHLYTALEAMNEADPTWPIVLVTETFYMGSHPMYNGAPLPKGFTYRPRSVNIHAVPYVYRSKDTFPFGVGEAPEDTPECKAKIAAITADVVANGPWGALTTMEEELMKKLGAVSYSKPDILFDTWCMSHDVTLQMCPRSLEYPRSDVPSKIRFAGAVPPRPISKDIAYPSFWDEVTTGNKKIVVTTQGTVAQDYSHIVMPTMRAMADREDVIVVGILGTKGAKLPDDFELPVNARVVDHLPYDAILPHASAFVINAGYGGFMHGVLNGVPMVMGGVSEDKPEVAARGEWAGVGVNLRTGEPSVEQVKEALTKVIDEPKFKKRIDEIRKENEEMKAMDTVEKAILEMAAQTAL